MGWCIFGVFSWSALFFIPVCGGRIMFSSWSHSTFLPALVSLPLQQSIALLLPPLPPLLNLFLMRYRLFWAKPGRSAGKATEGAAGDPDIEPIRWERKPFCYPPESTKQIQRRKRNFQQPATPTCVSIYACSWTNYCPTGLLPKIQVFSRESGFMRIVSKWQQVSLLAVPIQD